jgi:hypothetical protein
MQAVGCQIQQDLQVFCQRLAVKDVLCVPQLKKAAPRLRSGIRQGLLVVPG